MENEELKIVILYKNGKASIGISKPDCDPHLDLVEGSMEEVVSRILGVIEVARVRWEENPRYPKCETDLTPAKPVQTNTRSSGKSKPKEDPTRPTLF